MASADKKKGNAGASLQDSLQALLAANPERKEMAESVAETEETPVAQKPTQRGMLDVIVDRKGRKGKVATIVAGWELPDDEVAEIASQMKRRLGIGGSARGGEILLQGDVKAQALEWLKSQGLKARII